MRYRPALDGMRGFAVAAVVAYHVGRYCSHEYLPGGWAGVDVFFVLSGFLITTILLDEISRSGRINMKDFYYRRFIRLGPALLILLAVLTLVSLLSGGSLGFVNILLSLAYLMNWSRAFQWFPGGGGFLGHTWSLSVEEQFYLIWPLALLLIVRFRTYAFSIVAVLVTVAILWRVFLIAHGAHPTRTYNGFDTHADPILIGCLLAFLPEAFVNYRHLASRAAAIPVLLLAVLLLKMHFYSKIGQYGGMTIAAICAGWILVATFEDGIVTKVLSLKPIVYTGRISYGWYLWHYPIVYLANEGHPMPWAVNVALVALAYLIAAASFHFVERPISARFKYRFQKKTPAGAVPGFSD